jgi:hypothetical protein
LLGVRALAVVVTIRAGAPPLPSSRWLGHVAGWDLFWSLCGIVLSQTEETIHDLDELRKLVGCHPLSIVLLAARIGYTRTSLREVIKGLQEEHAAYIAADPYADGKLDSGGLAQALV